MILVAFFVSYYDYCHFGEKWLYLHLIQNAYYEDH